MEPGASSEHGLAAPAGSRMRRQERSLCEARRGGRGRPVRIPDRLRCHEPAGRAYDLTGPQALTHRQQVEAISAGLGRAIAFEALTYGQARRAYIASGFPAEIAEFVLGYQAEYAEEPPALSPTFEQVTGRKGRTLAQWAAYHAAELASSA
ncbi:hypothetical protein [Nonomuraea rubra]|uniref:hypothetical protein n=1 Tax=Nonomuraea rubra TaxID=46180 RepID=UPI0033C7561D